MSEKEKLREALRGFKESVVDVLLSDPEFVAEMTAILSASDLPEREKVRRLRERAYFYSRRFRLRGIEVAFAERGAEGVKAVGEYVQALMETLGCGVIVDVGSGLFPITVGEWAKKPELYYAIDKDPEVVQKLRDHAERAGLRCLKPILFSISTISEYKKLLASLEERPCIALYSRVLRTLWRSIGLRPLEVISATPARVHLVLEPKLSLVKGEEVAARERTFLKKLLRDCLSAGVCFDGELLDFPADVGLVLHTG